MKEEGGGKKETKIQNAVCDFFAHPFSPPPNYSSLPSQESIPTTTVKFTSNDLLLWALCFCLGCLEVKSFSP